jgi:hypothetical protein
MNSLVALPIAAAIPTAAPAGPREHGLVPMLPGRGAPSTRKSPEAALHAYASWLFMERRILCMEIWPHMGAEAERYDWHDNAGAGWHFRGEQGWQALPQPSTRAAGVLDLVGVDWRQPREDLGLNHVDTGERPGLPDGWPRVVDPAIELAERAISAWDDFEAKCLLSSKAEELVIDWKKLNPQPVMRAAVIGSNEDYQAFRAGLSTYDPNADLDAAAKGHSAALKEWGKRRRSAEKAAGYTRAERVQALASERFEDIRDELYDARPTSIAGLRAKARAARVSSDDGLQQQIMFDIGVLFGDLDENEKPVATTA